MSFSVYALSDPRTDELRYVGKTTQPLQKRLRAHTWPCELSDDHRSHWVKSLLQKGLEPKIELIEEVQTQQQLDEAERFYIQYFNSLGMRLVNSQTGGAGWTPGMKRQPITEEHRKKLSLAKLGKKKSFKTRQRMSVVAIVREAKKRKSNFVKRPRVSRLTTRGEE